MKKIVKKTVKIQLTDTLHATLLMERVGQQPADIGDAVMVRLEVQLPAVGDDHNLSPELQFSSRLSLMGEWLYYHWGQLKDGRRFKSATFVAPTWREAFAKAEAYGSDEICKLADALHRRAAALEAAEEGGLC